MNGECTFYIVHYTYSDFHAQNEWRVYTLHCTLYIAHTHCIFFCQIENAWIECFYIVHCTLYIHAVVYVDKMWMHCRVHILHCTLYIHSVVCFSRQYVSKLIDMYIIYIYVLIQTCILRAHYFIAGGEYIEYTCYIYDILYIIYSGQIAYAVRGNISSL